ncbi:MAG TPA: YdbH domain-containing protein [Pseudomonadales bacterium]
MPSSSGSDQRPRGRFRRRLAVLAALVVAVPVTLLAALQLAWPWLAVTLGETLAAALGADRVVIVASRPGFDRLAIERLTLEAGRLELFAEQGVLRYRLLELITGRLRGAAFETVRVSVLAPRGAEDGSASGGPPDLTPLFAALPEEGLVVHDLLVRVPALGFQAAGSLRADPRRFEVELAGQAPAEAQGYRLRAALTPNGTFDARLAERGSGAAPVLDVVSRVVGARRELAGSLSLAGLPSQLAAHLAGLPAGELAASGSFSAELPWPPPTDWLMHLHAAGRLQGGWRPSAGASALEAAAADWRLRDGVLAGEIEGTLVRPDLRLPLRAVLDSARIRQGSLAARGTLRVAGHVTVPFVAEHRLDTGAGTLTADAAHRIEAPLGETLLPPWKTGYDLTGGRLDGELAVRWPADGAALGGRARLRLTGIDGYYGDYRLRGLQGLVELTSSDDGRWSMPPARLHLESVDVGIALTDIEATLGWSPDELAVDALSLRLLGGRARTEPFAYRFDGGEADFVVELASIDLAEVLALEGGHVSGSGTLDGRLPVQIRAGAPSVIGGRIQAVPPGGVIRVTPSLAAGAGQPGLDFAMRALENFRYQRLAADVDYTNGGDLTLAVHLEGRNPAIEGGRPIHYNLTVTQNVPTLLRALRLQEQVTRRIEERASD